MRVLAIGSHPDDCELGAGATLARHRAQEDEIFILILGRGVTSRQGSTDEDTRKLHHQAIESAQILGGRVALLNYPDQRFDSVDFLQIVQSIEEVIERIHPVHVYTHHAGDLNLDHQITHRAVLAACRPIGTCPVKRIDTFEVPSSTEWGSGFWPTVYVDVTGAPTSKKFEALACYEGEMREPPHPRSFQAVRALAFWRGASAGVGEAEAFQLVREIR